MIHFIIKILKYYSEFLCIKPNNILSSTFISSRMFAIGPEDRGLIPNSHTKTQNVLISSFVGSKYDIYIVIHRQICFGSIYLYSIYIYNIYYIYIYIYVCVCVSVCVCLVWFYGISILVAYSMANPFHAYILNIWFLKTFYTSHF